MMLPGLEKKWRQNYVNVRLWSHEYGILVLVLLILNEFAFLGMKLIFTCDSADSLQP
jgi:hypothetical protein